MPRTPPYHVLVDVTGAWGLPQPGLLIEWRKGDQGWEAWVITANRYRTGMGDKVEVRQGWHAAHHVRPVDRD